MAEPDHPRWIEIVARVAGAIGMNRTRVRWRLLRWVDRPDAGRWRGLTTGVLVVAAAVVLVRLLAAVRFHGASLLDLPPELLIAHGANLPDHGPGLREATSLFVHADLFHGLLGLAGLAMAGSMLEDRYRSLVAPIFLATGVLGACASDLLGRDQLGVGAAAGVMGLLGLGMASGHLDRTPRGRTHRNELAGLAVFVAGFGLFVDTDYRALLVAALAGAALAHVLPHPTVHAHPRLVRALGITGSLAALTLATLATVPAI